MHAATVATTKARKKNAFMVNRQIQLGYLAEIQGAFYSQKIH